jgi:hypothetical protein
VTNVPHWQRMPTKAGDELAIARDFGRVERGWHRRASAAKSTRMSPRSSGSLTRGFQRLAPITAIDGCSTYRFGTPSAWWPLALKDPCEACRRAVFQRAHLVCFRSGLCFGWDIPSVGAFTCRRGPEELDGCVPSGGGGRYFRPRQGHQLQSGVGERVGQ